MGATVATGTATDLRVLPFAVRSEMWTLPADKLGRRVAWRLNACQRICDYEIELAERAGRAALIKVIKCRQSGISTFGCGRMQDRCQGMPNYHAITIADKLELPRQWLDRAGHWHRESIGSPPRTRSNAHEVLLANGSRYEIGSAEGKTPGMGATTPGFHASEIEYYSDPQSLFGNLYPAIPWQHPQTLVFLESCGEMEGSYWHTEVTATQEGEDDFRLIFLPWWLCPEYSRPDSGLDPGGYTEAEQAQVGWAREWVKQNPVWAAVADTTGELSPDQLAWRRWAISNLYRGDEEKFACRYPATIAQAFMGVGSLAIPVSIVRQHGRTIRAPIGRGRLEWEGSEVTWVEDQYGPWTIYEPCYTLACEYAIGADIAEGASSDPADPRSERDYSAMGVLNRRTLTTVASFLAHIEADEMGRELFKAAVFWNQAWISPEANSAGQATLAEVRDYAHLKWRNGIPEQADASRSLDRLGWRTTPQNRDLLIDEWIEACRPDQHGDYEGRVKCLCPDLAGEERTFVRTATGKREHRPGRHDDLLFAYMIALQVHKTCPHIRYSFSPTGRTVGGRPMGREYAGGVDDLSDMRDWDAEHGE